MIVAVDVDDTVAHLTERWVAIYNEMFGTRVAPSDFKSWDIGRYLDPLHVEPFFAILDQPSLYDDVRVIDGALEGVEALRGRGHRVVFVTSCTQGHAGKKLGWLRRHGFLVHNGRWENDYVECSDKSLIRANVLIDDRFSTVKNFSGVGILYHAPHNTHEEWPLRAQDWSTIPELVEVEDDWRRRGAV